MGRRRNGCFAELGAAGAGAVRRVIVMRRGLAVIIMAGLVLMAAVAMGGCGFGKAMRLPRYQRVA